MTRVHLEVFLRRFPGKTLATFGLVLVLGGSASADLVINGGFETGDFTGWTQFGDGSFTGVDANFPFEGTYAAFFGPTSGTGGISQDLATVIGETYHISFALKNLGGTPNSFSADFGSAHLMDLTDDSGFPYTVYSFDVVATNAITTLSFTFLQAPSFYYLDSVHVVPEPSSVVMVGLAIGLGGFVALRRRRGVSA